MTWPDYILYCYERALAGSVAAERHLAAMQCPTDDEAPAVALCRAVIEARGCCMACYYVPLVDAARIALNEMARCSSRLSPGLFDYAALACLEKDGDVLKTDVQTVIYRPECIGDNHDNCPDDGCACECHI